MKLMLGGFIISLSFLLCCQGANNHSSEFYWADLEEIIDSLEQLPSTYRALQLDIEKLKNELNILNEVILPLPKGNYIVVEVKESTTMSPELAAKYPEIKSYVVKEQSGIVSGRIDINPSGFYAMIVTDSTTYFINPTIKKGQQYICYDKNVAKANLNNPFYDQIKNK